MLNQHIKTDLPTNQPADKVGFDSEHPKARLSVSTGAKIENLMSVKMKNNIKQITEVNQIKYITAKFAFGKKSKYSYH